MSDIIQLLPDALANQIAAGEVVQRPSSVVKELLENAIDAQSTNIRLIIKDAGKSLIQVVDNGIGMSLTDARMCLERHATSKIRKSEDLFGIRTMGFRGEAMASIVAVSQVEIRTRTEGDELGTALLAEASEMKLQEPTATEKGTSVCVKNLFYNIPARRNFLKSNSVETKHIMDEFQRISLSHPDVVFSMHINGQDTYSLSSGKLSHRIVGLFGKSYQEQLAACEEITSHLTVRGYVGKPESAKKTRGEQFFFVNKRFIKNNYLNHAVVNAYEGLIAEKTYPFYVLFIEMDPSKIDVNVHPTKTEIKFEDERTVYGIVRAAVTKALGTHNLSPSINFDYDVNFNKNIVLPGMATHPTESVTTKESNYTQFRTTTQQSNLDNWGKLYDGLQGSQLNFDKKTDEDEALTVTIESSAHKLGSTTSEVLQAQYERSPKAIFQLHGKYLVTQVKSGLLLIDQQVAHERILYEQYRGYNKERSGASQKCLFPQTIDLSPSDFALVMGMKEEIEAIGFLFEAFGKQSIVVNGIPVDTTSGNEKELFEGLIEQFKHYQSSIALPNGEMLAQSIAKRSAVRHGKRLEQQEMQLMIDRLFGCETPAYAPDGKATFRILSMEQLEEVFG